MPRSDRRALRQQLATLNSEAEGILNAAGEREDGVLTEAEQARYDTICNDLIGTDESPGTVLGALRREEAAARRDSLLDLGDEEDGAGAARPTVPAVPIGDTPRFQSFGEQLVAVARASTPEGAAHVDPRLQMAAPTGASSGVPSDGGFMVQTDFAAEIERRAYETAILASRCRELPVGPGRDSVEIPYVKETSRATGSRWGGVQVYRAGEADTVASSRPKIGRQRIELEDLRGLYYATDRLLEDAVALEALTSEAFVDEFAFVLDNEIIRGSGAGECLGLLNSKALVSVAKESGQTAGTIVPQNIVKMYSRCWGRSRRNSIWTINQDIEPQLLLLAFEGTSSTIPMYMPPNGLSQAPFGTLMGRPVIPIEQADTIGTKGDIMLMDLDQYRLIRKGGLRADSSMHVRFIYHEQTFRLMMRVNGQPRWQSALTPFKGSLTQSPYVSLDTRA